MVNGPDPGGDAREAIAAARRRTLRRIDALEQTVAVIIEGSEHTSTDDEHDPEGATIAYERAQAISLLAQARLDLDLLGRAEARLAPDGTLACVQCGARITPERIVAMPTTDTCVHCARGA